MASHTHNQETAAHNHETAADNQETVSKRPIHFFQLPREIRDEIYLQYCYSTPRTSGPLEGYVDIPSPAPLAVCRQMREELSPVVYESLKHTLIQDRVCLKIQSRRLPSRTRYAGWNVWVHNWGSSGRSFNVWVRDGDEEGDYAAWWVEARNLCALKREFGKVDTGFGTECASHAFEQFLRALEKLQVVAPMITRPLAVKVRLNSLVCKVLNTLEEVKKLEAKANTKVEMLNWHPGGNATYQNVPAV